MFKVLFLTVTGKADINIKKLGMDFEMDLSTQQGTPSYDVAPKLSVSKVDINVNPDDIDIKLTGDLVSKIASALIPLLKSTVVPTVIDQVKGQVQTIVNGQIDQDLKEYGTQALIPYLGGVTIDFGQEMGGPQVSQDSAIMLALNGTFFDADNVQPSQFSPASFTPRDPAGKQLQGYLTDFVANTLFESGFLTGNTLDLTYLLKTFLNLTVTTSEVGVLIPEIVQHYGADKPVQLSAAFVKEASQLKFLDKNATIDLSLALNLTVDGETALGAHFENAFSSGNVNATGGTIYGEVGASGPGTISNYVNNIDMSLANFTDIMEHIVGIAGALLNDQLQAGIKIPSFMGVDLSDIEIEITEGLVKVGLSASSALFTALHQGKYSLIELKHQVDEIVEAQESVEESSPKFL